VGAIPPQEAGLDSRPRGCNRAWLVWLPPSWSTTFPRSSPRTWSASATVVFPLARSRSSRLRPRPPRTPRWRPHAATAQGALPSSSGESSLSEFQRAPDSEAARPSYASGPALATTLPFRVQQHSQWTAVARDAACDDVVPCGFCWTRPRRVTASMLAVEQKECVVGPSVGRQPGLTSRSGSTNSARISLFQLLSDFHSRRSKRARCRVACALGIATNAGASPARS